MVDSSQVQNAVLEEVGDLENAEAISDFHRDYNQIKYVRNINSRLTLTCTFRNSPNLSKTETTLSERFQVIVYISLQIYTNIS